MSIFTVRGGAGEKTHAIVRRMALGLTIGMLLLSGLMASSGPAEKIPQIGIGLTLFLVYAASLTVGGFLGFLFGLPRGRLIDPVAPGAAIGTSNQTPTGSHFLANSNLIKVSDWLTTIIIGLTLVNLGAIVPAASDLGNALSKPLGGYEYSAAIGLTVAIGSVLAGFLLGYLWASLRVRELLEEAERQSTEAVVLDLKGLTVDQAKDVAPRFGLGLVFPSSATGTSVIVDHSPGPGTVIGPGVKIKVTI